MRRLLSGYAQFYNRRHKRAGHLFQNRYKSIICEEEAYFDKLVAYIHINPLKAGIVESFEELARYPWSGHAVLIKRIHHDWFDRDYVLRFFGSKDGKARRAYLVFLEEEMGIDRESELSGGGLVRSHGGWVECGVLTPFRNIEQVHAKTITGKRTFLIQQLPCSKNR